VQAEEYEVDIDKAQEAMVFMGEFARDHVEELTAAEEVAKNQIMGMVLTSVETGLVANNSHQVTELRAKLFMAFDIGYAYGRLGAGKK